MCKVVLSGDNIGGLSALGSGWRYVPELLCDRMSTALPDESTWADELVSLLKAAKKDTWGTILCPSMALIKGLNKQVILHVLGQAVVTFTMAADGKVTSETAPFVGDYATQSFIGPFKAAL